MDLEKMQNILIDSSAIDVVENKKDEEFIGHLAAIVEYCQDAIISKSLDGTIRSWNKGAEQMFGYTAKEVIGKNISLTIPVAYIDEEKKILKSITNNESIDHYETVRIKKNGEEFCVSLTVSPLKDKTGNIIGVSKIARDITSNKKSESELINANRELIFQNEEKEKRAAELIAANKDLTIAERRLKDAIDELESFSYSVSHDLRAPLRAISGYSKMLKRNFEGQLDSEANRLMNNIMNNATKMGQLIDDLLNFSRIGRKELLKMNVQMQTVVTNLCFELKNEYGHRGIEFQINELFPVQADNVAIRQVWVNLISNAIKYSKLKDNAIIEIGSQLNGNEIIYYIKDNGAGFDMRYADKLFGVFQRLHSDEEFEGTGVGLALVQRIIAKHGGRVWGEGKVNEGATFYFTLNKS
jgi:PAS domain S-box-containing protein